MQISMNQGTGLSEWNWLTEGCHLCAWKMMDPICKLLLYPTAPPNPQPHHLLQWLLNKEENLWLFWKMTSGLVKIGTLLAISSDCQGAHRGPVRFQSWRDWLSSWTLFFIFLSFSIPFSTDINKMKPISMNLQTHKWSFQNIRFCVLDWKIYCFFPLTPWLCLMANTLRWTGIVMCTFCTMKLNTFMFHI